MILTTVLFKEVLFKQESIGSEKSQKSFSLNHNTSKVLINIVFLSCINVDVFSKSLSVTLKGMLLE